MSRDIRAAMETDPYMVGGGDRDDDDAESLSVDEESDSGSPSPKRARTRGSGKFTSQGPSLDGPSAELELEEMLRAEQATAVANPGSFGAGGGGGMGGPPLGAPGPRGVAGMVPPKSAGPMVETTPMDFQRLSAVHNQPTREVPVPKDLCPHLMTAEHRILLMEEGGAEVEWEPQKRVVKLRGSQEQVKRATRLLQRVMMHCHWGKSEAKVGRLIRPNIVESVIVRLSPMNTLRPVEKTLSCANTVLTIGKEKGNDLMISDNVISRQHCVLELDIERGAVYAINCSTNGTFLNDVRLPAKTIGKVLISHGDELLFKDPATGDREFGYVVCLFELQVKKAPRLEAPRRILTQEDFSSNRDL